MHVGEQIYSRKFKQEINKTSATAGMADRGVAKAENFLWRYKLSIADLTEVGLCQFSDRKSGVDLYST